VTTRTTADRRLVLMAEVVHRIRAASGCRCWLQWRVLLGRRVVLLHEPVGRPSAVLHLDAEDLVVRWRDVLFCALVWLGAQHDDDQGPAMGAVQSEGRA
jgi:hypothetical protein